MSIVLNGTTQYLKRDNAIVDAAPFTVSAFFKSTNDAAIQTVWGMSEGTDTDDYWELVCRGNVAGDPLGAYIKRSVGPPGDARTTTGYTTNTWHHAGFVEASSQDHRVYIDGGSKHSDVTNDEAPLLAGKMVIGALAYSGGWVHYFYGKICQVAMWNIALSDAEMLQLSQGVSPTTIQSDNLVAFWPLLDDLLDDAALYDLTAVGGPGFSADSPSGVVVAPSDKVYSRKLVAIANHEVWYESTAGTLSQFTDATVNTTNPLSMTEAFQKLFIANKTNLKVMDFINTKITTGDLGAHPPDFGTVLTGDDSGAKMIVDYITSLADDAACTIYGKRITTTTFSNGETVKGTDDDDNAILFDTNAAETDPPHWYNWTVFGNDSSFGTMPSQAYLICLYRGRLVLSGNINEPHMWYMSKVADPFNFIYSQSVETTAVAGNNIVGAGRVGDIIRALIPFGDDYLVFGCANSMYLLDGDPAASGKISRLSETTGIYSWTSWCKDDEDNLYFFGRNGIYRMGKGRERPDNISKSDLPQLISDWALDPTLHRVVMVFDAERKGILIFKTTVADGTCVGYFLSLDTKGFYPFTLPTQNGIFSACDYNSDTPADRALLLGSFDGYIRSLLNSAKDNDIGSSDEAISSYFGMVENLSIDADNAGKLTSLTVELAGGFEHRLTHAALAISHIKGDILTQVDTVVAWLTATDYVVGDVILDTEEYICIVAHTSNVAGGDGTEGRPSGGGNPTQWATTTPATMIVDFTDSTQTHTFGHSVTGTFDIVNNITSDGSGTAFIPTAVSSGSFANSDGCNYEYHAADDAETVLEYLKDGAAAHTTGTLSGTGRKNRIRSRIRGAWLALKFYNSGASETFGINRLFGIIKQTGKLK